jgi:hypothetical protein
LAAAWSNTASSKASSRGGTYSDFPREERRSNSAKVNLDNDAASQKQPGHFTPLGVCRKSTGEIDPAIRARSPLERKDENSDAATIVVPEQDRGSNGRLSWDNWMSRIHCGVPAMIARLVSAMLAACWLMPAPARAAEKTLSADRVEVHLALASDGSVGVTETTVFRFGGPRVTRQLSTRNTDGIVDIAAAVDGVSYPVGRQAGHIRIERENGVTVTWRLAPLADTSRTLTLTYRIRGAVRRETAADVVSWRALPIKRPYEARAVTVVASWPAGAALTAIRQVSNGRARHQTTGGA